MADEKKTYYLAADGMRVQGRRYRRGDKVELSAEQGDRLVESGSLVESESDLEPRDTSAAATAGLAPIADEKSTLYGSQTVDEEGEVLESSFGHPDQVEAAEQRQKEQDEKADATKPAAARRRSTSTADTSTASTADARDADAKPAARK